MKQVYLPGIIGFTLFFLVPWIWIFINSTIATAIILDATMLTGITLILTDGESQYDKGYKRGQKDMEKSK